MQGIFRNKFSSNSHKLNQDLASSPFWLSSPQAPLGEDLPAAGAQFLGCSVLAAAAVVAFQDASRCWMCPYQPTHTHSVHHNVVLVVIILFVPASSSAQNEYRLHHDPEDRPGNTGILGTPCLTCNWYPTRPLSASWSARLVSAPRRPGPIFAHSSNQNLQIRDSSDGSVENKDFVQGIYPYLSVPSFDQESTSVLLWCQLWQLLQCSHMSIGILQVALMKTMPVR